jgi:hypothetical protein
MIRMQPKQIMSGQISVPIAITTSFDPGNGSLVAILVDHPLV